MPDPMIALAIPRSELGSRAQARTAELERCLKMNPDFIFMMDLDQTVPLEVLHMFYRYNIMLETWADSAIPDWDILVVDAPTKYDPDSSNVYYNPDKTLDHFTISCCLIRAGALRALPKPWFRSDIAYIHEGGATPEGKTIYRVTEKYSDDNVGEDVYFSKKVLSAGWKVSMLPYKCNHYDLGAL